MAVQTSFGAGGVNDLVFNLRVDTSQALLDVETLEENFVKLEQIALRYLTIARRAGIPEDVQAAVNTITKLIVVINQARLTLGLLHAEMGPIGWATYGAAAILLGFSITDTAGSFT